MAVKRKSIESWACLSLLALGGACRSFHFCETEACAGTGGSENLAQAGAGGAGNGGRGAEASTGSMGASTVDEGGAPGAGSARGAGGSASLSADRENGGAEVTGGSTGGSALGGNGPDTATAGSDDESAGAAGTGNTGPECEAPFADCDHSTFTLCETNTASSPQHCGGCDRKCRSLCRAGTCLDSSVLGEKLEPGARGLARGPTSFYALAFNEIYSFGDAQLISRKLLDDALGARVIEAGADRLFIGGADFGASRWRSLRYESPSALVDEEIDAFDVKYMDGALFWVDATQTVYVKASLASRGMRYCVLPKPAFEINSVLISRLGPDAPGIFREGFGEEASSDFTVCPPFTQSNMNEPVSGSLIAKGGNASLAVAGGETFYWVEDNHLFSVDRHGVRRDHFTVPDYALSVGPLVLASSGLVLSYVGESVAGLFVIPLESTAPPEVIGMFSNPKALYVDEPSARLCFDDYISRIVCVALTDLMAPR
jgi:hypothetical protein